MEGVPASFILLPPLEESPQMSQEDPFDTNPEAAEKYLDLGSLGKLIYVKISFLPMEEELPELQAKHKRFQRRADAVSYINAILPNLKATGSPVQNLLRRAALIGVDSSVLNQYHIQAETVEIKNEPPARPQSGNRAYPWRSTSPRVHPSNRGTVLSRSPGLNLGGPHTPSLPLPEPEIDVRETPGEAEED